MEEDLDRIDDAWSSCLRCLRLHAPVQGGTAASVSS